MKAQILVTFMLFYCKELNKKGNFNKLVNNTTGVAPFRL